MTITIDFEYKSATCQIIDWEDGSASLANVYCTARRQGHATELLNKVMRWIDDRGLLLKTAAEAYGPEPKMPNPRLVEFYMKFGLVPLEDISDCVYMERKPK